MVHEGKSAPRVLRAADVVLTPYQEENGPFSLS
jgi:hypothetical protein